MIQTQLEVGIKPAAIALGLNRSASMLSRELHRNRWARPKARRGPGRHPVAGGYRAEAAHKRAHTCTVTPRVERRLRPGTVLWDQAIHYLKAGYSPEQIAGTLALVNSETPMLQVSHETIYTAIYAMPRGELRTEVIGWKLNTRPRKSLGFRCPAELFTPNVFDFRRTLKAWRMRKHSIRVVDETGTAMN